MKRQINGNMDGMLAELEMVLDTLVHHIEFSKKCRIMYAIADVWKNSDKLAANVQLLSLNALNLSSSGSRALEIRGCVPELIIAARFEGSKFVRNVSKAI